MVFTSSALISGCIILNKACRSEPPILYLSVQFQVTSLNCSTSQGVQPPQGKIPIFKNHKSTPLLSRHWVWRAVLHAPCCTHPKVIEVNEDMQSQSILCKGSMVTLPAWHTGVVSISDGGTLLGAEVPHCNVLGSHLMLWGKSGTLHSQLRMCCSEQGHASVFCAVLCTGGKPVW